MPDWNEWVRGRLEQYELAANGEEVVAELAAHLEETYEQARASGLSDAAATKLTLQEVNDWRVLAKNIRQAKFQENCMNDRTRSLWLPGMVTLLGASAFLMVIQRIGFQPRLMWMGHTAMLFYWPWLAGLPVFGAVGAYMSRRAQGRIPVRLAAGLSPALVMFITMLLILPWGLAIDGFSFFRMVYFGIAVTNWVALPAVALLAGALPFLREPSRAEPTRA